MNSCDDGGAPAPRGGYPRLPHSPVQREEPYNPAGQLRSNQQDADPTVFYLWDPSQDVPRLINEAWGYLSFNFNYGLRPLKIDVQEVWSTWLRYDHEGSSIAAEDLTDIPPGFADLPTTYDPFGNPQDGTVDGGLGYRGELQYEDRIHLRNRDYDPATGTFLTPDLLDGVDGTPTVANPYHYTDNDPLNKTDPLGLRPDDDGDTFRSGKAPWEDVVARERARALEPGCVNLRMSRIKLFMRARLGGPPCGFERYEHGSKEGYEPKVLFDVKAAEQLAVNPSGGCSKPSWTAAGITLTDLLTKGPVGAVLGLGVASRANNAFDDSCRSHDYGYDLLRFAKYELDIEQILPGRRTADRVLNTMMGRVCGKTGYFGIFRKDTCQQARGVIHGGVSGWTRWEGNGLK